MKKTVPHFNQMTAVAFSDIVGFGIGLGVVALALKVMYDLGLGLWGCGLVNMESVSVCLCITYVCLSFLRPNAKGQRPQTDV